MDLHQRISSLHLDERSTVTSSQTVQELTNSNNDASNNEIIARDMSIHQDADETLSNKDCDANSDADSDADSENEHENDCGESRQELLDICSSISISSDEEDDDNSIDFRKRPMPSVGMKKRFVINLLDDSESNSEEEEEEEEEEGDGYASAVSQMSDSNSKSIHLLDTSDEDEEDDDEDKDPTNGMNSRKISRMKQLTLKDKWANVLSPSSSEEEDEDEDEEDEEEDESVVDDSNHDMLEIASVASEIKNPFSMAIAPPSPSKPSHLDLSFSESDDSYAAGTRSRSSSTSPSYPPKSTHTVIESEEQSPAALLLPELPESPMKLVQDEQEQDEGTVWCRNSKNGSFRLNGSCTSISGNDVWPNMELNPKFYQNLYPHQRIGIQWLASMHCKRVGGILGDDMGLGKVRSKLLLLSVVCFSIALSTHYITLLFCCVCWYSHHIIIDYANFRFDFWINEYRYH